MESIQSNSSDSESLYESTLEQVIQYDRKSGKVVDPRSLCDLDIRHYKQEIEYQANSEFSSPEKDEELYRDLCVNNEIIHDNPYGKFSAIDLDESITPYSRKITGSSSRYPKGSVKAEEVSSDSSQEEVDNYKAINNFQTCETGAPTKHVDKFEIEEAMVQNSVHKQASKKKRKKKKKRKGKKKHRNTVKIIPGQKKYYNFTFSSDEEEETKQTTTKQSDSSFPEFDFNDEFEPPEDGVEEQIEKKDLHRLVFSKGQDEISQQYEYGFITKEDLARRDHRGNTPLHLAAKLSKLDEDYLLVVEYLLEIGAKHKEKDFDGWTIIDEAISTTNIRLLGIIYDFCAERKRNQWKNRDKIINNLRNIPDFYLELKWEFNSTVIPFLSKFTPKDTYKIWKFGSSLRLDFTLVGVDKLKGKRRDMTIIFRDPSEADDPYNECYVLLINRSKGIVVDPIEELDYEEKIAVLEDILNSDSVKADVEVSDPDFRPATNMWGSEKTSKINGSKCSEFKLSFESNKRFEKKGTDIFQWTEEEYFDTFITQEDHEDRILDENPDLEIKQGTVQNKTEKRNAYFWLDPSFELTPGQFFSILETLQSGGNIGIQKLYEYLQHDNIKQGLEENGFPVKISIPFGYTINAKVLFNNFEFIEDYRSSYRHILPQDAEDIAEVFQISPDFEKVSRKEGMKTMKNKKKRLAFANFIHS
ncbi:unnamed protein product [Moneuplotes crassus]|uniref:Ankyrin repeat domain-containing protein n=2 Tax=Euplotes crassus TaxID=5936 RepID=A0AAD1YCX7_EUPCR|nr:unnamed protein product [Moneuplotes crassus]